MAYITQAGVGLGLAKEVAVEFPEFGNPFATIIISVIVLNQIVGPPLFKLAIQLMKEDHSKAEYGMFESVKKVVRDRVLSISTPGLCCFRIDRFKG